MLRTPGFAALRSRATARAAQRRPGGMRAGARPRSISGAVRSTSLRSLLLRPAGLLRSLSSVAARPAEHVGQAEETRVAITPTLHEAFDVVACERVDELDVIATLYTHRRTGAEVLSLRARDENKVFGVTFKTPVDDSRGVPHILEHSVLCGSRKYPVKEPFVELLKSSVQTFLNAFTYPDRTCYPVASPNLTDFYNLVDVYMDAVFHPRLTPQVLQQEGWHLEVDGDENTNRLTYQGVVYNEMKGVFSSPDSRHHMEVQSALFPDNTYVHCSGGDPVAIPDLTFEQFTDFHATYYHPSNARLFFCGDDDEAERLKKVEEYLGDYERREVTADVSIQRRFSEPRYVTATYPSTSDEGEGEEYGSDDLESARDSGKHMVSTNWVLHEEPFDEVEEAAVTVLNHLLMGNDAAPLQHALSSSGIGQRVIGGGLSSELRQMTFSAGLKGVRGEDADKVEGIVLSTLQRLVDEGFDSDHVEAALNTLEFQLREFAGSSGSPKGLMLMLSVLPHWLYGRDPVGALRYDEAFATLRKRIESGEPVFEDLVRRLLLDNTHRVTVHHIPDSEQAVAETAAEAARLEDLSSSLSDDERDEVVRMAEELRVRQQTPDDPEALKCIPRLSVSDMSREVRWIDHEEKRVDVGGRKDHATVLLHDQPTTRIAYVSVGFGVESAGVPVSSLPLLPLFSRCLTTLGTSDFDEVAMSRRIGANTGGVSASFSVGVDVAHGVGGIRSHVFVGGKAIDHKIPELGDILRDVLLHTNFDQKHRVAQFVREEIASLESAVLQSGHSVIASMMGARFSKAAWVNEATGGGISYLNAMRELLTRIENDWEGVHAEFCSLREQILWAPSSMIASVTADERTLASADDMLESVLESVPGAADPAAGTWNWPADGGSPSSSGVGIAVPTHVNYVGSMLPAFKLAQGELLPGSATVVSSILSMAYLWEHVRVQGGAYGGFCDMDALTGLVTFLSYRDPRLGETLDVFRGATEFLRSGYITQDDIDKSIISTIGSLDAPMTAREKGSTSLSRYLSGITLPALQRRRDEILATTVDDVARFADALEGAQSEAAFAAVASEEAFAQLDSASPGIFTVQKPL